MNSTKVLSLGQCAMDHSSLVNFFQTHFHLDVVSADTAADARAQISNEFFALVLVNRVLDADQTQGMDFIKSFIKHSGSQTPVMLISNFQEAQNNAVAAGAVQGFGKAELNSQRVIQMIRDILANKMPIN